MKRKYQSKQSKRLYNAYGPTRTARSMLTAAAAKKAMRSVLEKKGMDTPLELTAGNVLATTNTNGSCFVLNLIRSGANSWNRIGRKVNLSSVRLRGTAEFLYLNGGASGNLEGGVLRMVVVWDKQPSSATIPTFASVFGATVQAGTESNLFLDPVRYDNMDRFSVLRDVVITLNPPLHNGAGGTADQTFLKVPFDEYIKLGGRECVFSGQTEPMTLADVSSGALYVYFRSDVNDAEQRFRISSNSVARLRYTD